MGLGQWICGGKCGLISGTPMRNEDMKNPWTIKNSTQIYDNPWITVTEHDVINPNGGDGIYGIVHFKNAAIGIIPYEDGHIWMVGQYRLPIDTYSWEIPEGGGPLDEDPLAAAKRELLEETGLTAAHYEQICKFHLSNSVTDEWGGIYLATGLIHSQAMPEDTEDLTVKKVQLDSVYADIEAGRITDSLTIMAVYKLMLLKSQGRL